ncbi:hypothetical protein J6590_051479 [Homalodisca vitripennis]|nr:hypothetical protein J6590_051479 [Homalodisca vitripennis]
MNAHFKKATLYIGSGSRRLVATSLVKTDGCSDWPVVRGDIKAVWFFLAQRALRNQMLSGASNSNGEMVSEVNCVLNKESSKEYQGVPGVWDLRDGQFLFSAKPGMFDFKGKAKWDAWNGRKGLGKDDAKKAYVEKVASLISTIGLK